MDYMMDMKHKAVAVGEVSGEDAKYAVPHDGQLNSLEGQGIGEQVKEHESN